MKPIATFAINSVQVLRRPGDRGPLSMLHDHSTVRPGGPFERGDKVRVSASSLHSFNRRGEVLQVQGGSVTVVLDSGARAIFTPWELTKVASL